MEVNFAGVCLPASCSEVYLLHSDCNICDDKLTMMCDWIAVAKVKELELAGTHRFFAEMAEQAAAKLKLSVCDCRKQHRRCGRNGSVQLPPPERGAYEFGLEG